MADAIFLIDNLVDLGGTTITASSEEAAMPDDNVADPRRSAIWRSGAGTSSYIDFSFPDDYAVRWAALLDVNLTDSGEIRVQGWSDALDGSVSVYDETKDVAGFVAGQYGFGGYGFGGYGGGAVGSGKARNVTFIDLGAYFEAKFWRVTFTDTSTGYQQCARVFFGAPLTTSINMAYGLNITRDFRSKVRESIGGQRYSQFRDSRLRLAPTWEMLTDNERTDFLLRIETLGQVTPFFFAVDPGETVRQQTMMLYGRFDGPTATPYDFNLNRFSTGIVEEL